MVLPTTVDYKVVGVTEKQVSFWGLRSHSVNLSEGLVLGLQILCGAQGLGHVSHPTRGTRM